MASHVCYWLAMATVQHGWLERPRILSSCFISIKADNDMTSDFILQFRHSVSLHCTLRNWVDGSTTG